MLANSFTKRDLRNMRRFATLLYPLESRGIADEYWQALRKHTDAGRRLTERKAEREVLTRHGFDGLTPANKGRN